MVYCQLFGAYQKTSIPNFGVIHRVMVDPSSEIVGLNTLDPHVLTAIHNRYYPDIYRFACFRVSDQSIAEDIAGEVFIRLLEAVHKGNGPKVNLRGWLLRTTANIVNDHFRNIYNRPVEKLSETLPNSADILQAHDDPSVLTDQTEEKQLILMAMEKLTDAQKTVISLRFGNRFSIDETAKILGKNVNTVKALQFRALNTLRRTVERDWK
jgi:RNA polymerase sigma-70 factor (ECF subfamily)